MNSVFVNRIIRACKLDVSLYEEVEADKSATFQAASVVILSIFAFGLANFFNYGSFDIKIKNNQNLRCFFFLKITIKRG